MLNKTRVYLYYYDANDESLQQLLYQHNVNLYIYIYISIFTLISLNLEHFYCCIWLLFKLVF